MNKTFKTSIEKSPAASFNDLGARSGTLISIAGNHMKTSGDVIVTYAVNDCYAPAASASLRSLIGCASKDRHYQVFILHTGLEQTHLERLRRMETENVQVSFSDASELMRGETWPSSSRFGPEIYLRLYAPGIFTRYPKLVYLDSDTIVLRDIADLFDISMDEAALGACWSFATPFMDGYVRHTVGLAPENYFNSGVLLINSERFEAGKIRLRCRQILREKPRLLCFDQDALNIVLNGAYCLLPDQWNVQWTNHLHPASDLSERPTRAQRARINRAEESPFILHYSSDFKPWEYTEAWGAQLFREAVADTPYREEFAALLTERKEKPLKFYPITPPWKGFRRNLAMAGHGYALKELFSNLLRLDGEVP